MALQILTCLVLLLGCVCGAPAKETAATKIDEAAQLDLKQDSSDLNTAASSYTGRYSDWGGYPNSGYGVTGYGTIDDKYSPYYSEYDAYSRGNVGYNNVGYGGGYNNVGYSGYNTAGYNRGYSSGYGLSGGYGGYGGYGGNGGLSSYTGYSNPYYQGSYHLGSGYHTRPHGNIYNSGITPNLVTGYRGYSR